MIDTRLITFITLIEEKSYTKTSQRLYVTQPSVTHHIKSLEREYNISLFENIKNFELTNAGKILYEYAKKIKEDDEALTKVIASINKFSKLTIDITPGIFSFIINNELLNKTSIFKNNPNIYVKEADNIYERLLCAKSDIGIIDNSFDSTIFNYELLDTNKIIAVCDPSNKYKEKEKITNTLLKSSKIVLFNEKSGLTHSVLQELKNKNLILKQDQISYTNNSDIMCKMILDNDLIGFMYSNIALKYIESGLLKKVEITNFRPTQNTYIIYKKSAITNENIDNVLNELKNQE